MLSEKNQTTEFLLIVCLNFTFKIKNEFRSISFYILIVKQRKEAIEQELGSSIKDAAPKFGLA